ncbi:hypothetical protein PAPYR_7062 [Paratrimastix pyriformis]|uniref:Uncharacterized protein n=1 Tax=Paratrimastix pyriformis TaxID=342808 RepID=A0ABQ8UL18_9EUKA|nr:hypothetical protein PAPYR_7062 [Paratrimastix pyriformis]
MRGKAVCRHPGFCTYVRVFDPYVTSPHPSAQDIMTLNGLPRSGKSSTLKIVARLLQDQVSSDTPTPWRRIYYFRDVGHQSDFMSFGIKAMMKWTTPSLIILDQFLSRPALIDRVESLARSGSEYYFLVCSSSNFCWEESVGRSFSAVDLPPFDPSLSWEDFHRFYKRSAAETPLPPKPPALAEAAWFSFLPRLAPGAGLPFDPLGCAGPGDEDEAPGDQDEAPPGDQDEAPPGDQDEAPPGDQDEAPPGDQDEAPGGDEGEAPATKRTPSAAPPLGDSDLAELYLYSNGIIGVAQLLKEGDYFTQDLTIALYKMMRAFLTEGKSRRHRRRANIEWLVQKRLITLKKPTRPSDCDLRFLVSVPLVDELSPIKPTGGIAGAMRVLPLIGKSFYRLGCPFYAQLYMKVLAETPIRPGDLLAIERNLLGWSGYPDIQGRICKRAVISQPDKLFQVPSDIALPPGTAVRALSLEPLLERFHHHGQRSRLPPFLHLVVNPCDPAIDLIRIYVTAGSDAPAVSVVTATACVPATPRPVVRPPQVLLLLDQITVSPRIRNHQDSLLWLLTADCAAVCMNIPAVYHCRAEGLRKVFVFIAPEAPPNRELFVRADLNERIRADNWEVWWSPLRPFLSGGAPLPSVSRRLTISVAPGDLAEIEAACEKGPKALEKYSVPCLRAFAAAEGIITPPAVPKAARKAEVVDHILGEWRRRRDRTTEISLFSTIIALEEPQKEEETGGAAQPQKEEETEGAQPQKEEETGGAQPQKEEETEGAQPQKEEETECAQPQKEEPTVGAHQLRLGSGGRRRARAAASPNPATEMRLQVTGSAVERLQIRRLCRVHIVYRGLRNLPAGKLSLPS